MREYTPARAGKTLEFLADERRRLLDLESERCTYVLDGGGQEHRPEYSYMRTREEIAELDRKTALLGHALHVFGSKTLLPDSGLTVDEANIRLGLMCGEKQRLAALRDMPQRRRVSGEPAFGGLGGEFECANFDVDRARRDYLSLCASIADLQLELARIEQTGSFSVEL